jgi:hypothetical protein
MKNVLYIQLKMYFTFQVTILPGHWGILLFKSPSYLDTGIFDFSSHDLTWTLGYLTFQVTKLSQCPGKIVNLKAKYPSVRVRS